MGRRGNGEGSIVHRKDGLWQGAISCGRDPTSGKWKRVTVYGRTRAEVADKLDQLRNQQRAGLPIEPQSVTVGQWIETWLQEYKKASLKPTTWSNYWYQTFCSQSAPVLRSMANTARTEAETSGRQRLSHR